MAVDVTPSNILSSAAVDVTEVPFKSSASIYAVPSMYISLNCNELVPKSTSSSVVGTIEPLLTVN